MQFHPMNVAMRGLYGKCVLTVIALLLAVLALRPLAEPAVARAQPNYGYLYIEPRTTMLRKPDGTRQVEGKLVIDLRNGNIWGFPTMSTVPYPIDITRKEPPVSEPIYLGKFDFSKIAPQ